MLTEIAMCLLNISKDVKCYKINLVLKKYLKRKIIKERNNQILFKVKCFRKFHINIPYLKGQFHFF